MRRRDPICRRGSLIQRARNRRRQSTGGALRAMAAIAPLHPAARAKRPRRMGRCSEVADDGENLEDHPALATRYVRRKAPFQHANCPANWSRAALNLFSFGPDKILPGTLHHSGNRPAPPSDHIPLGRRSAFQQGRKRGRRGNSAAPAGLKHSARRFYRAYARRRCLSA